MFFKQQIPLQVHRRRGHLDITMDSPAIPSFADVLWVSEDVEDRFTKFRSALLFQNFLQNDDRLLYNSHL